VNDEFVKKYRYRDKHIRCCATCSSHWNNPLLNTMVCGGPLTKNGLPIEVSPGAICKMYYPKNQEAGK
jgi:hypothetical protein